MFYEYRIFSISTRVNVNQNSTLYVIPPESVRIYIEQISYECEKVTVRVVPCRAVTVTVPCRAVPCRAVPCRAVPCRAVTVPGASILIGCEMLARY
jgi:hypothetical protein